MFQTKEFLNEGERGEWKSWLKTQLSKNWDHGIQSHHFMTNRVGKNGNSDRFYFIWFQNHCGQWLQPWNSKMLAPWKKSYDKSRQHIKKQRHHFSNKGLNNQSYGFSHSHVWMRCGPQRRLSAKELMLSNCAGEDSWESLGLQGDQTSQSSRQSILNVHWKDWGWSSNTLAT